MDALNAMGDAAGAAAQQGVMAPFLTAVSRGVSANLCDAVVGLLDVSAGDGLDIRMAWSRTRPAEDAPPSRILFGSDSRPLIAEAARVFRETTSADDLEIEGIVTRLNREPTAMAGEVTVTGNIEGRMRRLSLTLDGPAYGQAVQAHDNRKTVRCVGDLVRGAAIAYRTPASLKSSPRTTTHKLIYDHSERQQETPRRARDQATVSMAAPGCRYSAP